VDDTSPYDDEEDEYDVLSALDFSTSDEDGPSDLEAFDSYVVEEPASVDGAETVGLLPESDEFDGLPVPLFTVTNPPGTVTVTTFMDGRVQRIELSSKVSTMTETSLADEVLVIARLATQEARSAQYAFMLEGMRQQGHDDVATRDFLSRDLDLPSPEQADEARASVFSTRYTGDHD
jgi:ESX secretion-associated protein EspD/H